MFLLEAGLSGPARKIRGARETELLEEPRAVGADRFHADTELVSDLGLRPTGADPSEDLVLAIRKRFGRRSITSEHPGEALSERLAHVAPAAKEGTSRHT